MTNYERLHHFDRHDFVGTVCDESSILKDFDGKRKALVTEFMREHPYRLLCTATAAPNDYVELGTSAEALGEMGFQGHGHQVLRQGDEEGLPRLGPDQVSDAGPRRAGLLALGLLVGPRLPRTVRPRLRRRAVRPASPGGPAKRRYSAARTEPPAISSRSRPGP